MIQVLTVVGARPQFIKASAVSKAFAARNISEAIVHTGQHYDSNMSNVFFQELEIPAPEFHLGIGSGPHGQQTGRMLEAIEKVILDHKPARVLVYGDTTSTLAAALAAAKLHVKILHVEAGLRSFNRLMPEEVNRVLTDHLSDMLFAPTQAAVDNLRHEGIADSHVFMTGDVMYDVALYFAKRADEQSTVLRDLNLEPKKYVLATIHRAENTDDPARLQAILGALSELANHVQVIFPAHPRTVSLLGKAADKLTVIEPVGYLDMVQLERHSRLVITDSGGVQKEAFFHQIPCVTVRGETEWVELVAAGWNRLAPPDSEVGISSVLRAALDAPLPEHTNLYGTGHAAEEIADLVAKSLGGGAQL